VKRGGLAFKRETAPIVFVIPREARNLSFFSCSEITERFLASLGMTRQVIFRTLSKLRPLKGTIDFAGAGDRRSFQDTHI
jgi:hypothetical protein